MVIKYWIGLKRQAIYGDTVFKKQTLKALPILIIRTSQQDYKTESWSEENDTELV